MADQTVTGAFELRTAQARRELRTLRQDAERTDRAFGHLGRTIDRVGDRSDVQRLRRYRQEVQGFRRDSTRTFRDYRMEWRRSDAEVRRSTERQRREIQRLRRDLRRLDKDVATPHVELSGIANAMTEIAALKAQLRDLGRQTARPRVSGGGVGRGGAGAAAAALPGGGGGSGFVRGLNVGGVALDRRGLALVGAALPAVNHLIGAAGALGAVTVSAAGGLTALGAAAGTALVGGVAPLMAVMKPVSSTIGDVWKAQEKLNDQIRKYGRASKQAAAARKELNHAEAQAPVGAGSFLDARRGLAADFGARGRKHTVREVAKAQQLALRAGRRGIGVVRGIAPQIGGAGIISGRAINAQMPGLDRFAQNTIGPGLIQGSRMFAENLTSVRRFGQYGAEAFINIGKAARPFLREATSGIERWSRGWATSTRDVGKTRDQIRPMVNDLKRFVGLGKSTLRLGGALTAAGRGAGGGLLGSAQGQLDTWTRQIQQNPRAVEQFFQRSADGMRQLARTVAQLTRALFKLGEALGPSFDRLMSLVELAGGAGLLTPGAGALLLGAKRGLGGGGARGAKAAAGGGGFGAMAAGGAAFGGARALGAGAAGAGALFNRRIGTTLGQRFGVAGARGGAPVSQLGARAGRFAKAGTVARGAARGYLPVAAALAALDAYSFEGGPGQKAQAALSSLTLGALGRPQTTTQLDDKAGTIVGDLKRTLSRGTTQRGLSRDIRSLGWASRFAGGQDKDLGSGADRERRLNQIRDSFAEEIRLRRGMVRDLRRQQLEVSRGKARTAFGQIARGHRQRAASGGVLSAFGDTADITLREAQMRKGPGRSEMAKGFFGLALQAKKEHPELVKQIDSMIGDVRRRFDRLGVHIRIVNGRILTGSRGQWAGIADAIRSQARRGVDETAAEFTRLNNQAIAALQLMGYSKSDAQDLIRYQRAGGVTASRARSYVAGGNKSAPAYKAPTKKIGGPAPEDRAARAGLQARQSMGGGLMGAKQGMGLYASLGRSMGLSVSSGLRPGSITSSGNLSLHSTGDAVDMSGGAGQMLSFAQALASRYGTGLDELIHTPLGFGIKNGKRVPLSYWGARINADHNDHVHVGDRTPGGAAAGMAGALAGAAGLNLRARGSGLGGVVGKLSSAASRAYALGLTQAVNGKLGAGGASSATGSFASQVAAAGLPPIFNAIIGAESGGNASALNPSGASGLTQIMMPLHQGLVNRFGGNVMDPMTNLRVAKVLYDQSGLAPWASSRGTWGRKGDGPGVRVSGASGRTVQVHMSFGNVSVQTEEQLRSWMGAAAEHAAERLVAALDAAETK